MLHALCGARRDFFARAARASAALRAATPPLFLVFSVKTPKTCPFLRSPKLVRGSITELLYEGVSGGQDWAGLGRIGNELGRIRKDMDGYARILVDIVYVC